MCLKVNIDCVKVKNTNVIGIIKCGVIVAKYVLISWSRLFAILEVFIVLWYGR